MTGWEKVIAATVLAVIGLVGLNLAIWRRLRVAAKISVAKVEERDQHFVK